MPAPAVAAPAPDATTAAEDAAPEGTQDGIMVALMVPAEQARTLAVTDGEAAADLHITLAYLGTTSEVDNPPATLSTLLDVVAAVAAQHPPVTGTISGVGRFTVAPDEDAAYLSYDSPALDWLRAHLVSALYEADLPVSSKHGFTAHITLAYLQPSDPPPHDRVEPTPLTFPELTVAWGAQRITVPFGVNPDRDAEGVTPEEIADPRTWAELRSLRSTPYGAEAKFFDESAHPRAAGGRFGPKQKPPVGQLPPDWLDRIQAGDTSFIKPKGGGGGKKKKGGKGGKGKAKRAAGAAARRARSARTLAARQQRDREALAEMTRRDRFDAAMEQEKDAEDTRRGAFDARLTAETDPDKRAGLQAAETTRRGSWTAEQNRRSNAERKRRRQFEIARRTREATAAVAEARARAQETATVQAAEGKGLIVSTVQVGDRVGVAPGLDGLVEAVNPWPTFDPLTGDAVDGDDDNPAVVVVSDDGIKTALPADELDWHERKTADPEPLSTTSVDALVDLLARHEEAAEAKGLDRTGLPTGRAVKAVYDRGRAAWPGQDVTALSRDAWALGRVSVFLDTARGEQPPAGYQRDRDLLPAE